MLSQWIKSRIESRSMLLPVTAVVVLALLLGFLKMRGGGDVSASSGTTFAAKRGDLRVTVLEGGSIEALASQEIRSGVKGGQGVKILDIVEEGYLVTKKDIENQKLLVELDSADLENRMQNQEITLQTTESQFIEHRASYEIQLNQNQSDITAARLKVKFALLDFEKYLGKETVTGIFSMLGLDERARILYEAIDSGAYTSGSAPVMAKQTPGSGPAQAGEGEGDPTSDISIPLDDEMMDAMAKAMQEAGMPFDKARMQTMMKERGMTAIEGRWLERMQEMGVDLIGIARDLGKLPPEVAVEETAEPTNLPSVQIDLAYLSKREDLDFARFADPERLEDGEAKQKLREFRDKVLVAEEDLRVAKKQLDGQRRLAEKEFITQTELELEEVKVNKASITYESSITTERLYINYEFPKVAEKLLSDYEEALSNLERTVKQAEARLSQAKARYSSSENRYRIEGEKLADLQEQYGLCTIYAEQEGLVVYGSSVGSRNSWRGNDSDPIQEGTSVRERQLIITIPDMTQMGVHVGVHESAVKRVRPGQRARVIVDANPESPLEGTVLKVAVLPDAQNRWVNPDLKVYKTVVQIDGVVDWLRPGMSAQIEILVEDITDVVYVPLQSITTLGEQRYVHIASGGRPERRNVETGRYSNDFIEIIAGLKEGEKVMLLPPGVTETGPIQPTEQPAEKTS